MVHAGRRLPPDGGTTEIRVHGVGGSSPQELLEQTGVYQVSGDETAGLYRGTVDLERGTRTVEAYSWGGITARDRNRAFWVLLLPFSMINLAGWMVEPAESHRPSKATRYHELVVLLIGMVTTATFIMWIAFISMNVIAFQCGAIDPCASDRWYLSFLRNAFFANHPGRRVVLGMAAPLAVLALFVGLGRISRSRYDDYGAPAPPDASDDAAALELPSFWYTAHWQSQAARLHVAATLAVLGGLLARATRLFAATWHPSTPTTTARALFWVAVAITVLAMAVLASQAIRYDRLLGERSAVVGLGRILMWAAMLVTAWAARLAWDMQVWDAQLTIDDAGVSVPVTDLWGFGWAPVLLLSLSIALVGAFSVIQIWRWLDQSTVHIDQFLVMILLVALVFWQSATAMLIVMIGGLGLLMLLRLVRGIERPAAGFSGQHVVFATLAILLCLRLGTERVAMIEALAARRTAPTLLCSLILAALIISRPPRPSATVQVYVVAATATTLLIGVGASALTDRWEWLELSAGLTFMMLSVMWLARFRPAGEVRFRWNGPGTLALTALALVGGGFAGTMIRLVDLLDADGTDYTLPATGIYEWLVLGFAVLLLGGALGAAGWLGYVWFTDGPQARDRAARRQLTDATARTVAYREVLAEAIRGIDVVMTVMSMTMLVGWIALHYELSRAVGADFQEWIDVGTPPDWGWIVNAASWIAVGVSVGAFLSIRRGLRDPGFRTRIGILWDVASFWPRTFHPFAPPTYTARTVPELQERIAEIAGEPGGRTILSGHSQGAVVSFAAIASLSRSLRENVFLVTHGNPLARFYVNYFPQYFPAELLVTVGRSLRRSGSFRDGSWLNFHRATDPIGDPISRADLTRVPEPPSPPPGVRDALCGPASGDVLGSLPDVRLDDPPAGPRDGGGPPPEVLGHGGYRADPRMTAAVDAIAEL
jgi:hypothetical protein